MIEDNDESEKTILWSVIIDVFLFSVRWNIPLLQTSVIDLSVQKFNLGCSLPRPEEINKVYKANPKVLLVEPMRKLLVDMFARIDNDFDSAIRFHQCSLQFLSALIKRQKTLNLATVSELKHTKKKSKGSKPGKVYASVLLATH